MQAHRHQLIRLPQVKGGVGPESRQKGVGQEPVSALNEDVTWLKNPPQFLHLLGFNQSLVARPVSETEVANPGGNQ